MADPAYLKNLRKFGAGEPTTKELAALEAELYSGPDSGLPLIVPLLVMVVSSAGFLGGYFLVDLLGSHYGPNAQYTFKLAGSVIGLFLGMKWSFARSYAVWRGECPHCGNNITIKNTAKASRSFDCPQCKGQAWLDAEKGEFRVHRQDAQIAPVPSTQGP